MIWAWGTPMSGNLQMDYENLNKSTIGCGCLPSPDGAWSGPKKAQLQVVLVDSVVRTACADL